MNRGRGGDGSAIQAHADMFNSAFAIGGPKCTIKTVQKLTGIVVTHFVEIDFRGFASMVSALNGVTVCRPETVSDPYSGLQLHPGQNHLDGEQALAYVAPARRFKSQVVPSTTGSARAATTPTSNKPTTAPPPKGTVNGAQRTCTL